MSHATCCVVNCKNTGRTSGCKFFSFPTAKHKLHQRINTVRRKNSDGSQWCPKPNDKICSAHFIDNKIGNEQTSPSYIPTIFPLIYKAKVRDETAAIKRHERYMKRRKKETVTKKTKIHEELSILENDCDSIQTKFVAMYVDQECQVETFLTNHDMSNTFICDRYIYNDKCNDVNIQTDLMENQNIIKIPNTRKYSDKGCNTPQKSFVNVEVSCDFENDVRATVRKFCGIDSINDNVQMLVLAGVTLENFQILLSLISSDTSGSCKISEKNRLLIFLVKIKTGLAFSAIGVIFSIHRTTASRIFFSVLADLACNTTDLIFWPDKDVVRATTPECFHPAYSNTRVIIDCTEFKIEVPSKVDNRVYTYSNYKKGFTAKLLVGITPSGFICFKSKVAGGRKSDSLQ